MEKQISTASSTLWEPTHCPLPLALDKDSLVPHFSQGHRIRSLRKERAACLDEAVQHPGRGLGRVVELLVRSRAWTWGRATTQCDYLLGALCPTPSVRGICECWILFIPLRLFSKAHTVLVITVLKNVSCCRVIAFYKFKSVAVI